MNPIFPMLDWALSGTIPFIVFAVIVATIGVIIDAFKK